MSVTVFRIDDRLIHGQVVEAWVPHLKTDEIIVVSDEISSDETRRMIMRFSTPEGVGLKIFGLEEAFKYLNGSASLNNSFAEPRPFEAPGKSHGAKKDGAPAAGNILVLLPGLKEAADMIYRGLKIRSLNIGGMHYSAGKNFSIGKAIFLSEADRGYLKFISGAGVELEGRGVPTDKPIDLMEALMQ